MALPEGEKLFLGDLRADMDDINTDMAQFTKRWNWKLIVEHQGYVCRKFSATNVCSSPEVCVYSKVVSSSYDCWTKYKEKST